MEEKKNMLKLSLDDKRIVENLRISGILCDIKSHRLDQSRGVILVSCADGDQMPDIFSLHTKLQSGCCKDPRIHTFAWNGGALRLVFGSPANKPDKRVYKTLLKEIQDARAMKGIDMIALYAHAPCGKAKVANLGILKVLDLLIAAKTAVKKENHGVHVACFLHVDYGGKKRTYFISREHYSSWREKNK